LRPGHAHTTTRSGEGSELHAVSTAWRIWTADLRPDHDLVRAGKVRYVGCSNYAGWQLMKALGVADRHGLPRFVSQQIHYMLQAREAEYELVPISIDQALGIMVWSPLAGGLLTASTAVASRDRRGRGFYPAGTSPLSVTRTSCTTSSRSSWT
jgi:aryl-alcohol dehydrogenase-like predicted oxidoreductase